MYRVVKKDEDLKAASETDKNVAGMGFKMTIEGVRAKYGEHWEEGTEATPPPPAPAGGKPASFAEGALPGEPDPIDALVAAELAQWQPLVDPVTKALQAALDESVASGETAAQLIARLPNLLTQFNVDALAQALTRAAFTARLAAVAGVGVDVDQA